MVGKDSNVQPTGGSPDSNSDFHLIGPNKESVIVLPSTSYKPSTENAATDTGKPDNTPVIEESSAGKSDDTLSKMVLELGEKAREGERQSKLPVEQKILEDPTLSPEEKEVLLRVRKETKQKLYNKSAYDLIKPYLDYMKTYFTIKMGRKEFSFTGWKEDLTNGNVTLSFQYTRSENDLLREEFTNITYGDILENICKPVKVCFTRENMLEKIRKEFGAEFVEDLEEKLDKPSLEKAEKHDNENFLKEISRRFEGAFRKKQEDMLYFLIHRSQFSDEDVAETLLKYIASYIEGKSYFEGVGERHDPKLMFNPKTDPKLVIEPLYALVSLLDKNNERYIRTYPGKDVYCPEKGDMPYKQALEKQINNLKELSTSQEWSQKLTSDLKEKLYSFIGALGSFISDDHGTRRFDEKKIYVRDYINFKLDINRQKTVDEILAQKDEKPGFFARIFRRNYKK